MMITALNLVCLHILNKKSKMSKGVQISHNRLVDLSKILPFQLVGDTIQYTLYHFDPIIDAVASRDDFNSQVILKTTTLMLFAKTKQLSIVIPLCDVNYEDIDGVIQYALNYSLNVSVVFPRIPSFNEYDNHHPLPGYINIDSLSLKYPSVKFVGFPFCWYHNMNTEPILQKPDVCAPCIHYNTGICGGIDPWYIYNNYELQVKCITKE